MSAGLVILLAGLAIVSLAFWPSRAGALVVPWTSAEYDFFTGSSCGSTDTVAVVLRSGAKHVRVHTPSPGAALRDDETRQVVARLTDVLIERGPQPAVSFTATGSDHVCTNPGAYPAGWSTDGLDFKVTYQTRERVRLGSCFRAPFRPRTVILTCADANWQLRGLRWPRWNGRVARGNGYSYENDCNPFCAAGQFHRYPVRVTASDPRLQTCNGRRVFVYQRLRITYTGSRPVGRNRSNRRSGKCLDV